jgi:L-ascorbate metabolism protein UlaG (beta-lactamase superfamily)
MTSPLRHLVDLVTYAGRRRGHDRHDAATVADLAVAPDQLGLPAGLELRWLGVAGFALSYEGTTVLIDPYVSRCSSGDLLRRRTVLSDRSVVDRWLPRADAVLVGHTHFDHALDAPEIARRDGATVYGSASARHLLGLHGLADKAVEVEAHRVYEIGPFEVTFVPSVHSKLLLGRSVPNGGEITCEHVGDLSPQAYECGQVWGIHLAVAGTTLYHQGSADLLDDEVRHRDIDVFLCGVAGRQFTPDYLGRILPRLEPTTIVVTHHDDFLRPLGGDQGFALGVDVARFPDEVAAVSGDFRVVTLPEPVPLGPAGASA